METTGALSAGGRDRDWQLCVSNLMDIGYVARGILPIQESRHTSRLSTFSD